jgi:NADH:quinone reductase (non-electrogenic)
MGSALQFGDIADLVSGVYPKVMYGGQVDAGAWSCGMGAGLIHDIPSVADLVSRIIHDAQSIVRLRLGGQMDQRIESPST